MNRQLVQEAAVAAGIIDGPESLEKLIEFLDSVVIKFVAHEAFEKASQVCFKRADQLHIEYWEARQVDDQYLATMLAHQRDICNSLKGEIRALG